MRRTALLMVLIAGIALEHSCASKVDHVGDSTGYRAPETYNFKFVGYDYNIDDPQRDRRSYYRIFLDKMEAGRTTIGLESQYKTFEGTLQPNRHLLVVEKWVLDDRQGKYVKVNNIDQPKPSHLYFGVSEEKITVITMKNDVLQRGASFEVEFER